MDIQKTAEPLKQAIDDAPDLPAGAPEACRAGLALMLNFLQNVQDIAENMKAAE